MAYIDDVLRSVRRPTPQANAYEAWKNAPNVASGLGASLREQVITPASYAIEDAANALKPVGGAIGDFVSGAIGTMPPAAAKPVAPYLPTASKMTTPALGANAGVTVQDPVPYATYDTPGAPARPMAPGPITDVPYIGRQGSAIAGLMTTGAATRQAGALQSMQQRDFANQMTAAKTNQGLDLGDVTLQDKTIDLETRREEATLRAAAANGDQKALTKLRNLAAAKVGKSPEEAVNEKLLDLYMKSVAEYNKDPANLGKAAPTFQDFLGGLPPDMFPNVSKYTSGLPAGMKRQVGTSGGKPVYEDAAGKRHIAP